MNNNSIPENGMDSPREEPLFLRKQSWDYFALHAAQRMSIFNFYVVVSSVILTTYFASFKSDSNLESARPALAALLCLISFIFWKLDERNKALIRNAERSLKYFEKADKGNDIAKIFTQEEIETTSKKSKGWRRILFWRSHLSYSNCFNLVFLVFFLTGALGVLLGVLRGLRIGHH